MAELSGPTDSIVHWHIVDNTITLKSKSYTVSCKLNVLLNAKAQVAAHCLNSNSNRSLLHENIPTVATSQDDAFFVVFVWPPHQQELSECWRGAVFHRDCLWQAGGKLYNLFDLKEVSVELQISSSTLVTSVPSSLFGRLHSDTVALNKNQK